MKTSFNDTIPPIPSRSSGFQGVSQRTAMIGGGLILALIIGIVLMVISNSGSLKDPLQRLTLRLESLQKISNDSKGTLSNPDLKKINSDITILTLGSQSSLSEPMKVAGRGDISEENRRLEQDTVTQKELQDARLAGRYDAVYTRVVRQKIDTLLALMSELYNKTSQPQLKAALNTAYINFTSLKKNFEDLKL